jgi:hypothetical protein
MGGTKQSQHAKFNTAALAAEMDNESKRFAEVLKERRMRRSERTIPIVVARFAKYIIS